MATLSYGQIKGLAQAVGFDEEQSSVMTAIAEGESSGRSDVVNPIGCVGVWQINQPVWVRSHPTWTRAWLQVPSNNAVAAKTVYDAQGYGAWEAYTGPTGRGSSGSWQLYIGRARKATPTLTGITQGIGWDLLGGATGLGGSAIGSSPTLQASVDVPGQLSRVADVLGRAGNWVSNPQSWLRVGYVLGGSVLAILALQSLFKPVTSAAAGSVLKAASVLPQGKAVSGVTKVAKVVK